MSSRDDASALDMLIAARRILQFVGDMDFEQLMADDLTRDAVLWELAVLGGATKRISQGYREAHPEIEWRSISGTRDRITHGYDTIDYDIVWAVIKTHVPSLAETLERILPEPPDGDDEA